MSDTQFSRIAGSPAEPNLWPVQTLPRQFRSVPDPPEVLDEEALLWVRNVFQPGAELMTEPAFGRTFQAFDNVICAHSAGSAIVMTQAALETLVRPGRHRITKRLVSALATLLEAPGPERERLHQRL